MADKDTITKEYMQNKATFADAFNFFLYDGKDVIKPEQLRPLDTTAIALPYSDDGKPSPVQKYRDVLKMVTAMSDGNAAYLILGIENQSDIHYAMPVRNMPYDALQYAAQTDDIAKEHRRVNDKAQNSAEFLSGFYGNDKLLPVITLTILWNGDEWTAPRSLFDMLTVEDKSILRFMSDYKLNLISPAEISDNELDKLKTELRIALKCLKHSNDPDELASLVSKDAQFTDVSKDTAILLNDVAGFNIEIESGKERFNMCKAIEGLQARAREEGILDTLIGLVKKGLLSIAQAAEQANMTIEEFEAKTGLKA